MGKAAFAVGAQEREMEKLRKYKTFTKFLSAIAIKVNKVNIERFVELHWDCYRKGERGRKWEKSFDSMDKKEREEGNGKRILIGWTERRERKGMGKA
jgi:recombinational DNA repair protein RecT